jgi:sulfite reductase (NADPH) flavoprotein alpha-component
METHHDGSVDGSDSFISSGGSSAPSSNRRVTVLYGSQMGTTRAAAELVARFLTANGFAVAGPVSLNRFMQRPERLATLSFVVLCVATFWRGAFTDDAAAGAAYLLKPDLQTGKRKGWLKAVSFAVCGQGSSSYELFNQAARVLDARFAKLGGRRLLPALLHDVDGPAPLQGALASWLDDLLAAFEAANSDSGND